MITAPRPQRFTLLLIVFGVSVALAVATAMILMLVVSDHLTRVAIDASVSADQSVVRGWASRALTDDDLRPVRTDPARDDAIQQDLARLIDPAGQAILQIKVHTPDGLVVHSNDPSVRGTSGSEEVEEAIADREPVAELEEVGDGDSGTIGAVATDVIEEYIPIDRGGSVVAVFEVYRNAAPVLTAVEATRRDVALLTALAALLLGFFLWAIFRATQHRLTRQTVELVEATRRDSLTHVFNHGTVVGHLAGLLEQTREDGTGLVGLALIDVDNMRLTNATHGHGAGDQALIGVAATLAAEVSDETIVGRFGPDEFIVLAPPKCALDIEPAITRVRARLADASLQVDGTDPLPITISAGICYAPTNGSAAAGLLAVASEALAEAKSGGGDRVTVARRRVEDLESQRRGTFDVLSGLVLAVDTKDHYTKRHCEEVARYAIFLAGRIDADPAVTRALLTAGLLHDVGKIGIPDDILRKPGPLTSEEYGIVKQHVALGDLMVRDLPDIELVRGGVRHHHERWDGTGYLDRLEGEGIPLIARILSVADAFSAMTSSRPYRKALDVRDALRRLEDAAGTQLDPTLVATFVSAIETAPDAPLPGDGRPLARLWTPQTSVA
ncbi:MAG: HD domain-containing phosphohydrolase [Chloroflexota bacterium]